MKTAIYTQVLSMIAGLLLMTSNAYAARTDLINNALADSFVGRAQVQTTYETNPSALHPEDGLANRTSRRIEIEVGASAFMKPQHSSGFDRDSSFQWESADSGSTERDPAASEEFEF